MPDAGVSYPAPCGARGSPGRVREWNAIHVISAIGDGKQPTNRVVQRGGQHELGDGQSAHREHQGGLQQGELTLEPAGTVGNLVGSGHPVATHWALAWKTAANRRKTDASAHLVLIPPQSRVKPLEEGFACGPGKGPAELRLFITGGLPNLNDPAGHRSAHDHGPVHVGAATTGPQ